MAPCFRAWIKITLFKRLVVTVGILLLTSVGSEAGSRLVVEDDVCLTDVTCFRGTTLKGEKFLIPRIGMDVLLHGSR